MNVLNRPPVLRYIPALGWSDVMASLRHGFGRWNFVQKVELHHVANSQPFEALLCPQSSGVVKPLSRSNTDLHME